MKKQRDLQKTDIKTVLIIFCLAIAIFMSGCSTKEVQTVKNEYNANQIIDVLNDYDIQAVKIEKGEGERREYQLSIYGSEADVTQAIKIIQYHCLAKPEPAKIEGGGFITSLETEKEQARLRNKLAIENLLRQVTGVVCVDVVFVNPEDKSMSLDPYKASATVQISFDPEKFQSNKEEIIEAVSKGVQGLSPENVAVILTPKPPRQVKDVKSGYNFTRIAMITGIGLATIIAFFTIVFLLQNKRRRAVVGDNQQLEEYEDEDENIDLLQDNIYEDYDDDENDGINLP